MSQHGIEARFGTGERDDWMRNRVVIGCVLFAFVLDIYIYIHTCIICNRIFKCKQIFFFLFLNSKKYGKRQDFRLNEKYDRTKSKKKKISNFYGLDKIRVSPRDFITSQIVIGTHQLPVNITIWKLRIPSTSCVLHRFSQISLHRDKKQQ